MTKRIISLLLAILLLVELVPVTAFAQKAVPFGDVKGNSWYYNAVEYVWKHGIFNGVSDADFAPDGSMTRGMFVTSLGRSAGIDPADYPGTGGFSDVAEGMYYAPYVVWAAQTGITSGVGGAFFDPNGTVTREQIAVFLYRYFNLIGLSLPSGAVSMPTDVLSISPWARDAVLAMWNAGILRGDGSGAFLPASLATRAEIATIYYNLDGVIDMSGGAATDPTPTPEDEDKVIAGGGGGGGAGGGGGGDGEGPSKQSSYVVTFVSNGGGDFAQITIPAGEPLGSRLPLPTRALEIFVGWYTDSAFTSKFTKDTPVNRDLTLYARYVSIEAGDVADNLTNDTYTLSEQSAGLSFVIIDRTGGVDANYVKNNIRLNVLDQSKFVSLVVTGSDGVFTVTAMDGFTPGASYRLSLDAEELYFSQKSSAIRSCDFNIAREENKELSINDDIRFIPRRDVADVMKMDMAVSAFSVPVISLGDDEEGLDEVVGSFAYSGNEKLAVDDLLCIYSGDNPSEPNADYSNDDIAYIKVTKITGDTVDYVNASAEEVLPLPETIPLSSKILLGEPTNTAQGTKVSYNASDLDLTKYTSLGLTAQSTVDVGDYIAVYYGETVFATGGEEPLLGQITDIEADGDLLTHVWFEELTLDEMQEQESFYTNESVSGEEMLEGVDVAAVERKMEQQAEDSGFVEQAALYMAIAALETESVQSELPEDFELGEISLTALDGTLETFSVDSDNQMAPQTFAQIAPMAASKAKVTIEHLNKKSEITTKTQKLDGGLRVSLTVSFTLKIAVGEDKDKAIMIDLSASFVQEMDMSIKAWVGTEWFLFIVTEWIANVAVDFSDYTALSFSAHIYTSGDADKINIEDEIQYIMSVATDREAAAGVAQLFELYQKMIAVESDYIEVARINIFQSMWQLAYGIIQVKISLDFVVGLNVNVAMGVNFEYTNGTRYLFWVRIYAAKAGTETTSLIDEEYSFQFYIMGMIGLRLGFELEFAVGLISADVNSIGVTVGTGVYFELYGYFMYEMQMKKGIKTSKSSGALYFELGIYLEMAFKAQAFKGKFVHEIPIFERTWPLYSAGSRNNVIDFAEAISEEPPAIYLRAKDGKGTLPSSAYSMYTMDMKDGSVSAPKMAAADFSFSFSNATYTDANDHDIKIPDGKVGVVSTGGPTANSILTGVNGVIALEPPSGAKFVMADLTITWKRAPLTFTSTPIARTYRVLWSPEEIEEGALRRHSVSVFHRGIEIWTDNCDYGRMPELPTLDELLSHPMFANYNYTTSEGETLNLAYDLDGAFVYGGLTPRVVRGDQEYTMFVPVREYELPVKGILSANGITSTTLKTDFHSEFYFSSPSFYDTGETFVRYSGTANVYDKWGNLVATSGAFKYYTYNSTELSCNTVAKYILEGAYAELVYEPVGADLTINFLSEGEPIPPIVSRHLPGQTFYLREAVIAYLKEFGKRPDEFGGLLRQVIYVGDYDTTLYIGTIDAAREIVYDLNNGYFDEPTPSTYQMSDSVQYFGNLGIATPKRNGFRFAYWATWTDGGFVELTNNTQVLKAAETAPLELRAYWEAIEYDVLLYTQHGNIKDEQRWTHFYVSRTELLDPVSPWNYKFLGWYDNPDFEGSPVKEISAMSYAAHAYYAKWEQKKINVTLDLNEGILLGGGETEFEMDCGDTAYLPDDILMHRDGHIFAGWYRNDKYIAGQIYGYQSDVTFKAKWWKATYTITLLHDPMEPGGTCHQL